MSGFPIRGATALVTGAAGGIGQAVSLSLASRGANLALLDRRLGALKETAAAAEARGARVSLHEVDMADAAAVEATPEAVRAAQGRLDILVNNAGVALGGALDQVSMEDVDWVLDINLRGLIRMTKACAPLLKAAPEARIVNISSIFGIVTPAGQAAYCASKFAVRGFSGALREELKGTKIGVTVIHPGGVATEIAVSARMGAGVSNAEVVEAQKRAKALLRMPPAQAGEIIVRAIERRRARRLVGTDAQILGIVERLFPVNHMAIAERLFGVSFAEKSKAS
ncbi:MAG: SDR family oxidoreductase [Pseudomonadota bacterium]